MWHTFKHFVHMQYFCCCRLTLLSSLYTGVLYEPRQCSLFWDYIPESKLCFASICAARPVHIQSDQSDQVAQLSTTWRHPGDDARCPGWWGATKNSAMALRSRNNIILYTRWVRGRMKAKQRWFKVTRELCHKWFHHFRHHVHDGHWTGEFATIIWRLHCFIVSFRGDVRGESGPR